MVEMFIIQQMSPIRPMLRVWDDVKLVPTSPIWLMLRVWFEERLFPIYSNRLEGLAPKLCHLGCHMEWVSVLPNPSILGQIWWNQATYWANFLEFELAFNPSPSLKWALVVFRNCSIWVHCGQEREIKSTWCLGQLMFRHVHFTNRV